MTLRESATRDLARFVHGSPAAFLQLLVAAARKGTFARIINCPDYPVAARTSDLSRAVSLLRTALADPGEYASTVLSRLYAEARTIAHRKGTGQFFTPASVAEWGMAISPPGASDAICDAGSGTAVFAEALAKLDLKVLSYVGIENDPLLTLCAAQVLETINAPESFRVWYANFLLLRRGAFEAHGLIAPSLVISNPPFVRSHHLRGRVRILADLRVSLGIKLSPFSGAGSYFLSRSAELLGDAEVRGRPDANAGRLLFFFPQEAFGAAHARRLRDDLRLKQGWTWRTYPIPRARISADKQPATALALFYVFERGGADTAEVPRESRPSYLVGDFLDVKRGISTGCNRFFVLTDAEAQRRNIPPHRLRRVLPTRLALKGRAFSEEHWEALRIAGHACWLVVLPNVEIEELETPVQVYLKEGVRLGLHATPTARRLRTWYSLPVPAEPPDIFITYLFRGAPRFVVNDARVLHLTNILGGRFRPPIKNGIVKSAVADLLNRIARRWIEEDMAGREYRGGLRKIEPREMERLPINESIVALLSGHREEGEHPTEPSLFD